MSSLTLLARVVVRLALVLTGAAYFLDDDHQHHQRVLGVGDGDHSADPEHIKV